MLPEAILSSPITTSTSLPSQQETLPSVQNLQGARDRGIPFLNRKGSSATIHKLNLDSLPQLVNKLIDAFLKAIGCMPTKAAKPAATVPIVQTSIEKQTNQPFTTIDLDEVVEDLSNILKDWERSTTTQFELPDEIAAEINATGAAKRTPEELRTFIANSPELKFLLQTNANFYFTPSDSQVSNLTLSGLEVILMANPTSGLEKLVEKAEKGTLNIQELTARLNAPFNDTSAKTNLSAIGKWLQ